MVDTRANTDLWEVMMGLWELYLNAIEAYFATIMATVNSQNTMNYAMSAGHTEGSLQQLYVEAFTLIC
jgi:hypothetical protein